MGPTENSRRVRGAGAALWIVTLAGLLMGGCPRSSPDGTGGPNAAPSASAPAPATPPNHEIAPLTGGADAAPAGSGEAAEPPEAVEAAEERAASARLWVVKRVSGGRQCTGQPVPRPTVAQLTSGLPFAIHDSRKQALAVCRACSCPAYAFALELLIDRADLAAARKAGFRPAR